MKKCRIFMNRVGPGGVKGSSTLENFLQVYFLKMVKIKKTEIF